jgi:hypothetical protein
MGGTDDGEQYIVEVLGNLCKNEKMRQYFADYNWEQILRPFLDLGSESLLNKAQALLYALSTQHAHSNYFLFFLISKADMAIFSVFPKNLTPKIGTEDEEGMTSSYKKQVSRNCHSIY